MSLETLLCLISVCVPTDSFAFLHQMPCRGLAFDDMWFCSHQVAAFLHLKGSVYFIYHVFLCCILHSSGGGRNRNLGGGEET